MLSKIAKLAESIDTNWTSAGRRDPDFATIAQTSLLESRLAENFSLQTISDWLVKAHTLPQFAREKTDTTRPRYTVYRHPKNDFTIEIQLWQTADTTVHDHVDFGVTQILSGSSLHASYRFDGITSVAPDLSFGKIKQTAVEWARTSDCYLISPGQQLIHQLYPLNSPTVTLTVSRPNQTSAGHNTYFLPGMAVANSVCEDPTLKKRMQLYGFLRTTGHAYAETFLEQMLFGESAPFCAAAFMQFCAQTPDWDVIRPLSRRMAQAHAWGEALEDVAHRSQIENRQRQPDAAKSVEERLFLSLLQTHGLGRKMFEFIEKHFPSAKVSDLLLNWATGVSQRQALNPKLMLCLQAALKHLEAGDLSEQLMESLAREHLQHDLDRDAFSLWGFRNLTQITAS